MRISTIRAVISGMKNEEAKMTAVRFAKQMGVDYSTVVRWLKQGIVPGAEAVETPVGRIWQIPESALLMERPKAGRKRSS